MSILTSLCAVALVCLVFLAAFRSFRSPLLKFQQFWLATCYLPWLLGAGLYLTSVFTSIAVAPGFIILMLLVGCIARIMISLEYPASPLVHYSNMISKLNDACLILHNGKIAAVNESAMDIITEENVVGGDPWEIWGSTILKDSNYEEWFDLARAEGSSSFTVEDDQDRIRISLYPMPLAETFLVIITDLSGQLNIEQRIQEQDSLIERGQDIAGLGYWQVESPDAVPEWSEKMNAIFGIQNLPVADQIAYRSDKELIHPADRDEMKSVLQKAWRSKEIQQWSFRVIRPDGEMRHVRSQVGPTLDNNGHVKQLVGVTQDVTDSVRAEERLRHAQKMEAVGELTGGLSHDFNNLLHVILGNVDLLGDMSNPEDKESVQAIRRSAIRGSELTQRLLAFSRKQILDPRIISINECVDEMLPLLRRTLGEAINILSLPDDKLFKCKVDAGQLENSILNLAINAQHAMPNGGTLTIETRNSFLDKTYAASQDEVKPGRYVQISISDTGCGMPEQILDRVFQPFFTTKEVGKGSGLGLSMVYGFIKQSGGHVAIYSELDKGTNVKLYLPIATPELAVLDQPISPTNQRFSGTALLVEDDAEVSTLTKKFLESVGFEVHPARHAEEAMSLLNSEWKPDLLLSDVILPGGVNGPAMARQIAEKVPGIRIVFMSGYTEHAIVHKGIIDPGVILLHKPFRKTDMMEKLQLAYTGPD